MRLVVFTFSIAIACSNGHAPPHPAQTTSLAVQDARGAPSPTVPSVPPPAPTIPQEPTMDEFLEARRHFAQAAATKLGKPESELEIWPVDLVKRYPSLTAMRTGRLRAFEARAHRRLLRGMATPAGEVVFSDMSLHVLAREALFANGESVLAADALAERIAWLHGTEYQLVRSAADFAGLDRPTKAPEPTFTDRRDGSVTLTFYMLHIPMHRSGAVTPYETVVKLSPTSAVLTKTSRKGTAHESP